MVRCLRILIVAGLLFASGAGACPALAQEVPPETQAASQPATPAEPPAVAESQPAPSAETTTSDVTPEEIQSHIAQLEAAADLPATVKTEAQALYRQTLDQLALATNWATKTAEFQKGREEAPQQLEQLRAELELATARSTSQPTVEVPADKTLEQINQDLSAARAALTARQEEARGFETEAENRATRSAALPEALTKANQQLEKTRTDLATPPAAALAEPVVTARRALLMAQKRAVEQEIRACEEEQRFYDARREVLNTRRALAKLNVSAAQALVDALETAAGKLRQAEIERQQQAAEDELQRSPRSVRELSEGTKALADRLLELEARIVPAKEQVEALRKRKDQLDDKLKRLIVESQQPSSRDTLGPEMRRVRAELISLRGYERTLRQHKAESGRVDEELRQLERERSDLLTEREARVAEEIEKIRAVNPRARVERLEPLIREALQRRYDVVTTLTGQYVTYEEALRNLIQAENTLLIKIAEASDFIDGHVLWVRSAGPIYRLELPDDVQAVGGHLRKLLQSFAADVLSYPAGYALLVATVGGLLALRPRLRREMLALRERVTRIYTDSFVLTLAVLLLAFLLALPWALLLWALGQRLPYVADVSDEGLYNLAYATGSALCAVAVLVLSLGFLRRTLRPGGLAESHFRWQPAGLRLVRRNLLWLKPTLAVCALFIVATERYPIDTWRNSVGRIAFLAGMAALALFAWRVMHPVRGVLANWLQKHRVSWGFKLRYVWYGLAVLIPVALVLAAAIGYYYTALQLTKYFVRSIWLMLGLLLLHALLVRWLFVAQRRLAIEQAKKKRAALLEAKSDEQKSAEPPPAIDETQFDLVTIGEQTRKLLRSLVGFALVIGLWLTWSDLLPALSFMQNVHLWSYTVATAATGNGAAAGTLTSTVQYITLAHLVVAVIIGVVTVVLARNIPGLLEITVLQRLPIDAGGRFAVTTLARYAIVIVGVVSAFGAVGIGWSKVQWLVTAMLVGLGFGLQEIFANFVSGLMLLFERPIRIGDTVTVGGVSGTVSRIRIRATTITDWDRKELVIPNKEFITGQVVNWTLSDPMQRVIVPVGIAYGSDTKQAEETLYRVAQAEPLVLTDPPPRVLFLGFGDSTLNFDLRVYIASIDHMLQVRHNLHMAIDQAFRAAGIEIAYPQRDIHIRSIAAPLEVVSRPAAPDTRPL